MNILNYKNAREVKAPIFDIDIETDEFGWIPLTINLSQVEANLSHMVAVAMWFNENIHLVKMKTDKEKLDDAKKLKKEELKLARAEKKNAVIEVTVNGRTFPAKTKDIDSMIQAINVATLSNESDDEIVTWKMSDNQFYNITVGVLKDIVVQLSAYTKKLFKIESEKVSEVESSSTVELVNNIIWE